MVDDSPSSNNKNITLFMIQIVSAVSGFVIAASCMFLRKWHPPIAYTAAFHISFWIGVQAIITHTAAAISVRLPDSSITFQQSKPLVRFLIWAQFAMPLWFVFLNAAIATDLLLSQLLRLNSARLQSIHRWYLPLATIMAFVLALPLLVYHSEYQSKANVFSVQFPSALSVTLYYILAFDLWIAIGIIYCFVVFSLVVSVIIIKLRKKRAAWNRHNMVQNENTWFSGPTEAEHNYSSNRIGESFINDAPVQLPLAKIALTSATVPLNMPDIGNTRVPGGYNTNTHADSTSNVCIDYRKTNLSSTHHQSPKAIQIAEPTADYTLLETVKIADNKIANNDSGSGRSKTSSNNKNSNDSPGDTIMSGITIIGDGRVDFSINADNDKSGSNIIAGSNGSNGSNVHPAAEQVRFSLPSRLAHDNRVANVATVVRRISSATNIENKEAMGAGARLQRPLLSLLSLPKFLTLRSSNRSTFTLPSANTPFRIPTLALVRLLLYPLIPILSFTLMCVVRWVWFRSAMPSQWDVLIAASGILRALEGFLCLIVFLLNPALNRSFREIRKRNTPVFN